MRKVFIIGLLLALSVWLLLLPGVVGIYLRDAVPDWLAEWSSPEEAGYHPGWFGSELTWQPEPDLRLRLSVRHFPPLRAGWLGLAGSLELPLSSRPADLRGHLGLTGGWHLHATAADFRPIADGPMQARGLALNLSQTAGQPRTLLLSVDELNLQPHSPGLSDLRVRALQRSTDTDLVHVALETEISDQELGTAGLRLQAGPIPPEQLGLLFQGLGQLAESTPGSISEGMALMTLVGAWQEMAAAGLVIDIERLQLGPDIEFRGRWVATRANPEVTGSGRLDELAEWQERLLPGTQAANTDPAEAVAAWLTGLGHLETEGARFRFSYPPTPDDPAR